MADSARAAALRALLQVEENAGYSNIVLDKALKASVLTGRDRALAAAIFYGVLEKRLSLDYFLQPCLRDPGKRPEAPVWEAMRCGAYQLLYMDRVPDRAAVNETVEAVKAVGRGKYAGLVNGVLRGLLRGKPGLALPQGDSPRAWAVRYSVPEPLIRLWMGAYGRAAAGRLLEAFQGKAGLYVRVNPLKTTGAALREGLAGQGIACTLLEAPAGAALLENSGPPAALPQFAQGKFHVQDLSAQWVCQVVSPQLGEAVCDCCAAPGGKSFTLAQMMGGTGTVYALDLYKGRVGLIREGARRLALPNIQAQAHDALQGFEGFPLFDRVLCDVPCSGFGVIRRKPEIRYKGLDSLRGLPDLQYGILCKAAEALKPGGLLVYATCTLNPAENGQVAGRFLEENPGFSPQAFSLPGVRREVQEPGHMLTMLPFSGASDGFFAAAFRKKG